MSLGAGLGRVNAQVKENISAVWGGAGVVQRGASVGFMRCQGTSRLHMTHH